MDIYLPDNTPGVEIKSISVAIRCKKCGKQWGKYLEGLSLPLGWDVCLSCASKERRATTNISIDKEGNGIEDER
jgi:hypothetical protein